MEIKRVKCLVPFTDLEIHNKGDCFSCCPAWTKAGPIGNLFDDGSIQAIWNSSLSQKIRQSVYNEDFKKTCNEKYCPYLKSKGRIDLSTFKTRDPVLREIIKEVKEGKTELKTGPAKVSLAISGRCNLRCIMCPSNERYVKENPKLNKLVYLKVLPKMLPSISKLMLVGNGDPFVIKYSRELLQNMELEKFPNLSIEILTNGLRLNKEMWKTISHNRFSSINVSIDAATKKTYEYVRRGGKWEVLQKNLNLISQLRKEGVIKRLGISFVVMRCNYKEMEQFVRMGLKLGCDEILFNKIFGVIEVNGNINLIKDKKIFRKIARIIKKPIFKKKEVDTILIDEYKKYDQYNPTIIDDAMTYLLKNYYYLRNYWTSRVKLLGEHLFKKLT